MGIRAAFFALALVPGANAAAAGPGDPLSVFAARAVPRGPIALAVGPARSLATERLGTDACRRIFEEVPDFTGRPVARRLEDAGRSPSAHFARLLFVEGAGGPCGASLVAAWSVAGDVRVRICPLTFGAAAARDRREAAAILIHEALHTLGVAEDAAHEPLTSFVRRRCGL